MLTSSEVKKYIDNLNDVNELNELIDSISLRHEEITKVKWGKANHIFMEMMKKAREINELGFDIYFDGDVIDINDLRLEAL